MANAMIKLVESEVVAPSLVRLKGGYPSAVVSTPCKVVPNARFALAT